MIDRLVLPTALVSIGVFAIVANVARARGLRRRGETVARAGALAQNVPYLLFVPYLVIAYRPGPDLPIPEPLRVLGLLLIPGGIAFSFWAIFTLGRHYDLDLEVHSDHELVRSGPYRFVRHPVYTGLALHLVGACVATGNVVLIVGTVLFAFPALYIRAAAEERLLRERFGAGYDAYAREVGALVPGIGRGRAP